MKQIKLTRNFFALVDDVDFERFNSLTWFAHAKNGYIYAARCEGRRTILLHREIVKTHKLVDHINGNTLDNRRENLREATRSQNGGNRVKLSRKNTSGLPGVSWKEKNKKWVAQIMADGAKQYLGLFGSKEEAFETYKKAHKYIFGEFSPY